MEEIVVKPGGRHRSKVQTTLAWQGKSRSTVLWHRSLPQFIETDEGIDQLTVLGDTRPISRLACQVFMSESSTG